MYFLEYLYLFEKKHKQEINQFLSFNHDIFGHFSFLFTTEKQYLIFFMSSFFFYWAGTDEVCFILACRCFQFFFFL